MINFKNLNEEKLKIELYLYCMMAEELNKTS